MSLRCRECGNTTRFQADQTEETTILIDGDHNFLEELGAETKDRHYHECHYCHSPEIDFDHEENPSPTPST